MSYSCLQEIENRKKYAFTIIYTSEVPDFGINTPPNILIK